MSNLVGIPSDELDDVLATGGTDVTTVFLSLSGRDPGGRDAEYLEWHALDHRPEQYRLAALRGSLRLVSTPACRAVRAAGQGHYDGVDHVMAYLFAGRDGLRQFGALGAALGAGGRMPLRLPSVEVGLYDVGGMAASRRAVVGADVVPWRPARGAYLLVEEGAVPAGGLAEVPGVAGVWWFTGSDDGPSSTGGTAGRQVAICYLDDDPVDVAVRLRPALGRRWAGGDVTPLLAAPFHVPVPFEWARHLP